MYHCHLQLYLVGVPQELAQVLKAIPPLERFTHHFLENAAPRRELAAQAAKRLAARPGTDPFDQFLDLAERGTGDEE